LSLSLSLLVLQLLMQLLLHLLLHLLLLLILLRGLRRWIVWSTVALVVLTWPVHSLLKARVIVARRWELRKHLPPWRPNRIITQVRRVVSDLMDWGTSFVESRAEDVGEIS
jgi:hypothetical protein